MKAITLYQPWATLVAIGAKRIETRSWRTNYRGLIAIHAAKVTPSWAEELCTQEPFRSVLAGIALPTGAVVGVARLAEIVHIPRNPTRYISSFGFYHLDTYPGKAYEPKPGDQVIPIPPPEPELSFGDYTPGRYAWILEGINRLPKPIPARGAQGLWEWNEEVYK